MKVDSIFLDTSFFIRLMKSDDPHHEQARAYLRRFLSDETTLYSSTIAAAEYGVAASIDGLPLRIIALHAFDLDHARQAAQFARAAFEAKRKGVIKLEHRNVIPNDTKLIAQAHVVGAQYIAGRDQNMASVLAFLQSEGLTGVRYLDITNPPTSFFGELF